MATAPTFSDDNVFIEGPSFHVDLSGLDGRHPVYYSPRLLIFRCASSTQRDAQLAGLKTGLKALVQRCPILGGIVAPLPPSEAKPGMEDWRTIVPDRGLELIVKDLRKSMQPFEELEAAGFPPQKLPSELLDPIPQGLGNDRPFAACKVQFSAIDGGTIITFTKSHSVTDGTGNNELVRVLSDAIRAASENSGGGAVGVDLSADTGLDRSPIRNLKSEKPFNIEDHPAYMLKTLSPTDATPLQSASPHPFEATSPEIPVLLRISKANLAQLKLDATQEGAPRISTHDALVALIWRNVILIRSHRSASAQTLPTSTISNFFMPSDGRRHLNIPQSYVGNAVYQLAAALDIGTLLSPAGLQHAASAMRRAITAVNPGLVSSLLAMTNEKWVDWQFINSYSTTGVGMGTDWTSGSVYSDDWGKAFGPLVSVRYPDGPGILIFPKTPNGSAELELAVMPDEVEVLRSIECFGKYLDKD